MDRHFFLKSHLIWVPSTATPSWWGLKACLTCYRERNKQISQGRHGPANKLLSRESMIGTLLLLLFPNLLKRVKTTILAKKPFNSKHWVPSVDC